MQPPNLFDFATSELSQDAFICWLASWADPAFKAQHEALHATATAFLDRLLAIGNEPKVADYRSVEVHRQAFGIDVLILVNGDIAIIIEDKTDTKDHSDQLCRYKKSVQENYPTYRIASVYFKTGDQCDYGSAEQAGYGCFLRSDFLDILICGEALGIENDIFIDFHRYLQSIETAVQSFSSIRLGAWKPKQWTGFFIALRKALGEGDWLHFGHGGGGTPTFRWHQQGDKFLRLGESQLAFKVEVADESNQRAKWIEWNRTLVAKSATSDIRISTPRRKLGKRMTVAALEGDYRQVQADGCLDLDATVAILHKAEALMDAALGATDK